MQQEDAQDLYRTKLETIHVHVRPRISLMQQIQQHHSLRHVASYAQTAWDVT